MSKHCLRTIEGCFLGFFDKNKMCSCYFDVSQTLFLFFFWYYSGFTADFTIILKFRSIQEPSVLAYKVKLRVLKKKIEFNKTLLHTVCLHYSLQRRKRHCCRRTSIRRRCWSPRFCTSPLTYLLHRSTKMRKSS